MLEVFLFLAGVMVGWALQHVYSAKASKEQRALFQKMSSELRDLILADPREHLSVTALNQLIDKRTIDPAQQGPLPYVACPKCGSKQLDRRQSLDAEHDEMYYMVGCKDCGWGDWSQ